MIRSPKEEGLCIGSDGQCIGGFGGYKPFVLDEENYWPACSGLSFVEYTMANDEDALVAGCLHHIREIEAILDTAIIAEPIRLAFDDFKIKIEEEGGEYGTL